MDWLHYEFMRNAVFAALLASIACGVIGSYVIIKRLVFISGGISHSAFGGIGLGLFLGIDPLLTVIPFTLLCAFGIGYLSRKSKIPMDTAIGIFWAFGMALGIIFVNLTPGYVPDLFSYLFGSILTVPNSDLML
ncbi:MAG: metal ABC transporter permease, partial [Candidatus Omnitrophica bacterium]|nr:metal ABC transporter permease [Candidatus Omnitrophota bacterium]